MSAKWQRVQIEIPKDYGPDERRAIAQDIINFIIDRTQKKGLDKNNNKFPPYSPNYIDSLDYRNAGKSKKVNLTLSGDMLGALDLLRDESGKIVIGYEKGSDENARADGNIRGTYGQSKENSKYKRDFLGISKKDLEKIISKYPLSPNDDGDRERNTFTRNEARRAADRFIEDEDADI